MIIKSSGFKMFSHHSRKQSPAGFSNFCAIKPLSKSSVLVKAAFLNFIKKDGRLLTRHIHLFQILFSATKSSRSKIQLHKIVTVTNIIYVYQLQVAGKRFFYNKTCFVYQNYCQGAQAYATIHASWQVQNVENVSLPRHWGQSKSVSTVIYTHYIRRYIFILSRLNTNDI